MNLLNLNILLTLTISIHFSLSSRQDLIKSLNISNQKTEFEGSNGVEVSSEDNDTVTFGVIDDYLVDMWCDESYKDVSWAMGHVFIRELVFRSPFKCKAVEMSADRNKFSEPFSSGAVDIYTDSTYIGLIQESNVSLLCPHEKDDIVFLIRDAPPVKQTILLEVPFSIYVATAACIIAFIPATVFGYGLQLKSAVFEVISSLITGGFDDRLRRLMVWMSLLSFFLWNFIGGDLTGSIVAPGRQREIHTLEDIDSNFTDLIDHTLSIRDLVHYSKQADGVYASLISKIRAEANYDGTSSFHDTNQAIITMDSRVGWIKLKLKRWYNFTESLSSTPVRFLSPAYKGFPIRKDWHLAQYFKRIILGMIETGLQKMEKSCEQVMVLESTGGMVCLAKYIKKSYDSVEPVSLENLKEAFCILMFGICIGVLSFIVENAGYLREKVLLIFRGVLTRMRDIRRAFILYISSSFRLKFPKL